MPKDPARNQPNYKIGGDHLNEYEFEQSHGQMTKQEKEHYPRSEKETMNQPNEPGGDEKSNAQSNG